MREKLWPWYQWLPQHSWSAQQGSIRQDMDTLWCLLENDALHCCPHKISCKGLLRIVRVVICQANFNSQLWTVGKSCMTEHYAPASLKRKCFPCFWRLAVLDQGWVQDEFGVFWCCLLWLADHGLPLYVTVSNTLTPSYRIPVILYDPILT